MAIQLIEIKLRVRNYVESKRIKACQVLTFVFPLLTLDSFESRYLVTWDHIKAMVISLGE